MTVIQSLSEILLARKDMKCSDSGSNRKRTKKQYPHTADEKLARMTLLSDYVILLTWSTICRPLLCLTRQLSLLLILSPFFLLFFPFLFWFFALTITRLLRLIISWLFSFSRFHILSDFSLGSLCSPFFFFGQRMRTRGSFSPSLALCSFHSYFFFPRSSWL